MISTDMDNSMKILAVIAMAAVIFISCGGGGSEPTPNPNTGIALSFTDSDAFDIGNLTENDQVTINIHTGVTGGTLPYTFSLGAGSILPAGITLSASGVISGRATAATAAGTATITVKDSAAPQASESIEINYGAVAAAVIVVWPEVSGGVLTLGADEWVQVYNIGGNQAAEFMSAAVTPEAAWEWCTVERISAEGKLFTLRVEANTSTSARTPATVTFNAGSASASFRVEQRGIPQGEEYEYDDDTEWD